MNKIKIQHIGAISYIELDLNKINVIMGPQSSGKSTIAKIISYCQWVEKRNILDGEYKYDVSEHLLDFHRLDSNYFSDNSFFEYKSDYITISYQGKELKQSISLRKSNFEYQKSKNIYIPAERNFVSAIPNLNKYNETNDNIMSFVYDWSSAKDSFTKQKKLPILNLGIDFYNDDERSDPATLFLQNKNKGISLRTGSSGLQSVVPLIVIIEYLTNVIYTEERPLSVNEFEATTRSFQSKDFADYILSKLELTKQTETKENIQKIVEDALEKRRSYSATNFIIEEPEQNLFPISQKDLIYYIFNKLNSEKDHSLLITTHSPFILYAINNCLLGAVIADKLDEEEKQEFESKNSWISPDKVNIFQIDENNGTISSIKNPKTGTVDKHYFNEIMNELMNEYYNMLTFFSNEK
ncbi:MAG: ATP-binding protein [Tannerellaceae bacterium]|jgi:predicted ATPase|nr:ATP-binding protein [Tannerellaceae bacterium]